MNPFKNMEAFNRRDSVALAECFVACNGSEESLHACIRFARRRGILPDGDYLRGAAFTGYHADGSDMEVDFYTYMGELRELAFEYLETRGR